MTVTMKDDMVELASDCGNLVVSTRYIGNDGDPRRVNDDLHIHDEVIVTFHWDIFSSLALVSS